MDNDLQALADESLKVNSELLLKFMDEVHNDVHIGIQMIRNAKNDIELAFATLHIQVLLSKKENELKDILAAAAAATGNRLALQASRDIK